MNTKHIAVFLAVLTITASLGYSQGPQSLFVGVDAANLALQDGTDLGPGNGIGLIGVFINPDNVTATPIADIQSNWFNFNWMAARFRTYGNADPGATYTFSAGGFVGVSLSATSLNSFSIGGAAASISLALSLPTYAWVFSGASIPTNQATYETLQTGVFINSIEPFGDGSPFGNAHSYTFAGPGGFGCDDPNLDTLPGFRVGNELRLQAVPEPSTVALALLGAACVVIARRRRK